jgi:hypothetical protein
MLHALARKHAALPFLRGLLELLYALLMLELALFCPQQALLLALRAHAFRLLRLQFLHALLHLIDALLALHVLARRHVARTLLQALPRLLNGLLNALFTLADPLLLRGTRGHGGWRARTRWCGDSRRDRARRCSDPRRSGARRCSDLRHLTRRHGRTLWRRSWPERRCGRPCHRRRWCRTCHRRRCRRSRHGGRQCCGSGRGRGRSGPSMLLG